MVWATQPPALCSGGGDNCSLLGCPERCRAVVLAVAGLFQELEARSVRSPWACAALQFTRWGAWAHGSAGSEEASPLLCRYSQGPSVLSKKHISLSFYVWCHTWENRARESLPHGFGLTNVASNGNAVSVKNSLLPLLPSALLYVWLH